MLLSQKCQYALRAVLELSAHRGGGVMTVSDIARAQAIPPRFLELILSQLRQAGYVESRRGVQGGYLLAVKPRELTVGQVIRCVDGPVLPGRPGEGEGAQGGQYTLRPIWQRLGEAVAEVFDALTFDSLLEQEAAAASQRTPNYCI